VPHAGAPAIAGCRALRRAAPQERDVKNLRDGVGYNERLFAGGIRKRLHTARFSWVAAEIAKRRCSCTSVIELGCFDGKLIDFLPARPSRYVGFDANWEGGLDLALQRWGDCPQFSFQQAQSANEVSLPEDAVFDVAVVMETLEHVPPPAVSGYLSLLARHLDGYLFVTVPNEKGPIFLAKWLAKRCFGKDAERYTLAEAFNATVGRTHLVPRNEHKGFDYAALVEEIGRHFEVIAVAGHPLSFLPTSLCYGVGIVARGTAGRDRAGAVARAAA
jgi:2-polyprenyl-3-methyl-5-hydroxy-6-metoxy-1,4-benzoquinol methylase